MKLVKAQLPEISLQYLDQFKSYHTGKQAWCLVVGRRLMIRIT